MSSRRPVEFQQWPAELEPQYGSRGAVIRFHVDGDTYEALVDKGHNEYEYQQIRLVGANTPEKNKGSTRAAGLAAQAFVTVEMPLGARVLLYDSHNKDVFGRFLWRIRLQDGRDLTQLLIQHGHAVRFMEDEA